MKVENESIKIYNEKERTSAQPHPAQQGTPISQDSWPEQTQFSHRNRKPKHLTKD
jgi:hypothetical protein